MIYIFFDLETTGFSAVSDKVIEIAAAAVDIGTHKVLETFQTFVNPGVAIPAKITEITSITDRDVANAPTELKAFEDFAKFLKKYDGYQAICGHNIQTFDLKWVNVRNDRFDLGINLSVQVIDTLVLVREVAKKGVLTGYNFTTPTGRPSFKLQYLMEYFELGSQNHRAIDDVLNNIIVYKKLIELESDNTSLGF